MSNYDFFRCLGKFRFDISSFAPHRVICSDDAVELMPQCHPPRKRVSMTFDVWCKKRFPIKWEMTAWVENDSTGCE